MANKTVLHELLAVEQGLAETSNRVTRETTKTLDSKKTIFSGLTKSHEILNEDDQRLKQATEVTEVQSTVDEQIDYMSTELSRYWDVTLQKEEANQRAKADIIIDGKALAKGVPSIVLLGMEKKLAALVATYNAIPTLDAIKAWEVAEGYSKKNVFRVVHPTERLHTVTSKEWKEISKATDKHPAQLKEVEKTEVIGKYTLNEFSGAISSYDKAERIQRLTALQRAVKAARQRANNADVNTDLTFGKELLDFVNGK